MSTSGRPDIYDFFEVQEYLRQFFLTEKNLDPLFSYRVFASAVQIDASLLVKILQGKRHLSRDGVERMAKLLRLDSARSEYLRELVAYGKATRDSDLRKHFERLLALRPAHSNLLDEDRYRYFQFWYYPAIRSALDVFVYRGSSDAEILGAMFMPKLTATQVTDAIEVLQRLGLVVKNEQGFWRPTTAHLSTGDRWRSSAVREFQRQMIGLGADSIANVPKDLRDISTLTLALDSSQMERLRAILTEARQSIVRQVNGMPPAECDAVYQLNMQLFPLVMREVGV